MYVITAAIEYYEYIVLYADVGNSKRKFDSAPLDTGPIYVVILLGEDQDVTIADDYSIAGFWDRSILNEVTMFVIDMDSVCC